MSIGSRLSSGRLCHLLQAVSSKRRLSWPRFLTVRRESFLKNEFPPLTSFNFKFLLNHVHLSYMHQGGILYSTIHSKIHFSNVFNMKNIKRKIMTSISRNFLVPPWFFHLLSSPWFFHQLSFLLLGFLNVFQIKGTTYFQVFVPRI